MIISFRDQGTEDIFQGKSTKQARKKCPQTLIKKAVRKLDMIDSASTLNDLRVPPGNQLEKLQGNRTERYSIRINDQYRICFRWLGEDAEDVEIIDYHK